MLKPSNIILVILIVLLVSAIYYGMTAPETPDTVYDVVRWDGKAMTMQGNSCAKSGDWFTCRGESVKIISVKSR